MATETLGKYEGSRVTHGARGFGGFGDISTEEDLVSRVWKSYTQSDTLTKEWRRKAEMWYDLIAGEQWDDVDKMAMLDQLRPTVTFNLLEKYIQAVSGLQKSSPQKVRYYPREPQDSAIGETYTDIADWVRYQAEAEDEEAEAFIDLLVCGMGWIEHYLNTEHNQDGEIAMRHIDPLFMYWDPNARKRNLSDARWLLRIKPMVRAELEEFLEELGLEEMIPYLVQTPDPAPIETAFPQHNENNVTQGLYDQDDPTEQGSKEYRLALMEYQYWENEWVHTILLPNGKKKEFPKEEVGRIKEFLEQNNVPYQEDRERQKIYYRAFVLGRNLLDVHKSPYQEGFTYTCMTGKKDRNNGTFYGLVQSLEEPQKWINKFFSEIMHILNVQAKGGVIADINAFDDPGQAEKDWARPDSLMWVDSLYDERGQPRVMPKPPPVYPNGTDRLMQFTMQLFPEISGINMETLGLANREQAGVVEAQRKQSTMTMLQWAFSAFRRYVGDHGRLVAYYIREYLSDGRIVRIDSDQGQKFLRLIKEEATTNFDVVVDEAPSSTNQKERTWAVLSQILPMAAKMGVPIPPDILEYSPIPASLATKWLEYIREQGQQGQEGEQQAQQLQLQQLMAEVQEKQAGAQLDQAKAKESQSETVLNLAKARESAAEAGIKKAGG